MNGRFQDESQSNIPSQPIELDKRQILNGAMNETKAPDFQHKVIQTLAI